MLKGTMTIELKNSKTGQIQKIVHDNMVTNCVSDMLKNAGLHPAPATFSAYSGGASIAENLFGGIMLWQNALNNNADDYIIPSDNKCIGYGCELSNNTTNDMMGTYNASESGALSDGYRHVWDFSTNQGNGQISAVSLTPRITGRLGLGLPYEKLATSLFPSRWVSFSDLRDSNYTRTRIATACPYLYVKGDYIYGVHPYNLAYNSSYSANHISRNGKKLILRKIRFSRNLLHLNDALDNHGYVEEEIEIQLPNELTLSTTATSWYGFCNYDNGHIYLALSNSYDSKSISIQICKINIETHACEVIPINIANAFSSSCIIFQSGSFNASNSNGVRPFVYAVVHDNKFITVAQQTNSSSTYQSGYVDFNEPTIYHRFKAVNDDESTVTFSEIRGRIGDYVYLGDGQARIANLKTGVISYINATASLMQGIMAFNELAIGYVGYIIPNADTATEVYSVSRYSNDTYTDWYFMRTHLPHVMTTKNNLEAPVLKTASQTMKITYILREVANQ